MSDVHSIPTLYLFARGEARSFHRNSKGLIEQQYEEELPESLYEDSDEGAFVVFEGTIHHGTQDLTEAELYARGVPAEATKFDAWWEGSMRAATDEEILAVFGSGTLAQSLLDARTEAVALRVTEENLRARIAALEAAAREGPSDKALDRVIHCGWWWTVDPMTNIGRIRSDDEMRAIIRAALARPEAPNA